MDDSGFRNQEFATDEEMVAFVTEHIDDIDKLDIMVVNDMMLEGPNGQKLLARDRCALLKLCSGQSLMIPTEVLQKVLDQGVLQRLRIPISLTPREAR